MKKNIEYNKIKINLFKGDKIASSFLHLKKFYSYQEFQSCLQLVFNSCLYRDIILENCRRDGFANLIGDGIFPMLMDKSNIADMSDQIKEFEFWIAYLELFSEKLQQFNTLRHKYEQLLLTGKYHQVEEILEAIDGSYGKSFWYIESIMLFYRVSGNVDLLHEFYEKIKSDSEHEIIYTYIRIIQRRVKLDISNDEYIKFCKSQIKQLNERYPDEKEMIAYVEFMSFYDMQSIIGNENNLFQHLLIIAQHLPLIDQYILMLRLELNLRIQFQKDKGYKTELSPMLNILNNFRERIGLLKFPVITDTSCWKDVLSIEYIKKHIDVKYEMYDKFLFQKGNYQECIESCKELLKTNFCFDRARLLVQAYIVSNSRHRNISENTLLDFLILRMIKLSVKTSSLSKIEIEQDFPRIFMSCSFGQELLAYIYGQLYAPSDYNAEDCILASLYSKSTISIEYAALLNPQEREQFLDIWEKAVGKCIVCIWSEYIRKIFLQNKKICWDEVSNYIIKFEKSPVDLEKIVELRSVNEKESLAVFLREEYYVFCFNKSVENDDFEHAFEIYVDLFFLSSFSVLRMNINSLNKRLNLGNCRAFYTNINFAVYAYNVELHYITPSMTSEYVKNCFRGILKVNKVDKPSQLKLPKDDWECRKLSYFLYYICDLKMLSVKGLYDIDAIEERKKILNMVSDKYECGREYEILTNDEIRLRIENTEKDRAINENVFQMKAICANWIKIPNENYITNAFQEISNHRLDEKNSDDIRTSWQYRVFREVVINCKALYIAAVNEKMGTTIRHCILERIMIQNLTSHKVYLKDALDIPERIREIPSLNSCPVEQQKKVLKCITEFFDKFFLLMDSIRKQIYFVEQEDPEKIRFYIPSELFEEGAKKILKITTDGELKELVMKTLHKHLENQMVILGDKIIHMISEGYKKEVQGLRNSIGNIEGTAEYLQILDEAIKKGIAEIKKQFGVTYNENQKHLLKSYVSMKRSQFSHISIKNECEDNLKIRNGIIWIMDIIFQNCIENVEKHAHIPMKSTDFKVVLRKQDDKKMIMTFENRISSEIDREKLKERLEEINRNIQQNKYLEIKAEDDEHGMGYYRIARFLNSNLNEPWSLRVVLNEDRFFVFVSLGLEENNEGIDC